MAMATIPRPTSATSSSPAGQSKTLSMKAVFSCLELPFLPEATLKELKARAPATPASPRLTSRWRVRRRRGRR